jgi:DNA processing protein
MSGNRKARLWLELAMSPGVRPNHVPALMESFGDIDGIFEAGLLELGACGIGGEAAGSINTRAGRDAAEQEAARLEKKDVRLIHHESDSYPPLLRRIADPPPVLYCLGDLRSGVEACVAIVGSRKASSYGVQAAHRLAGDLAARGVTVVSGMARGIDQAAHNGALEAGGRTVAVIGSGLGRIYPSGSERLVERITSSGAVVSEFSYDTPPSKITFPQRNRIVSGMSYATVVVEASERSGALITARLALEQDRELLAVPGPISSRTSIAPNYMIKRGAKLVQRAEDIIDELPGRVRHKLDAAPEEKPTPELEGAEARVLEQLSVDSPAHIDIIARRVGMSTADLSLILLGLEMKSLARQLPGAEYVRVI